MNKQIFGNSIRLKMALLSFITIFFWHVTSCQNGTPGTLVLKNAQWDKGLSHVQTHVRKGKTYGIWHDEKTGLVNLHIMNPKGKPGKILLYKTKWTKGWTHIHMYEINGLSYGIFYNKRTGKANIHKMKDDGTPGKVVLKNAQWDKGLSHVQTYVSKGKTYGIWHDEKTGLVNLHIMNPDGKPGKILLYKTQWSKGWSHIHMYEINGLSYGIFYNKSTGKANIHKMKDNGTPGKMVLKNAQWDKGLSHVQTYVSQGKTYGIWHDEKTGLVNLHIMNPDGKPGKILLHKTKWSKGWSHINMYEVDGVAYGIFYNKSTGRANIHKMDGVSNSSPSPSEHPLSQADAILDYTMKNGKVYFFKGDQYWRYDWNDKVVDRGYPLKISSGWKGLKNYPGKADFSKNLDAVVNRDNKSAYFFKGAYYIKYDIKKDKILDGYPLPIRGNWKDFPTAYTKDIDASYSNYNGVLYFFKDGEYIKYDLNKPGEKRLLAGYPKNSASIYKYANTAFGKNVKAAFRIGKSANVYLWDNKGKYFKYDALKYKAFSSDYPYAVSHGNWNFNPKTTESGFRIMINGIQCLQTGDDGNSQDEIYIDVFVDGKKVKKIGPRSMNEADDEWQKTWNSGFRNIWKDFAQLVGAAKEEFWLMPGSFYAEKTVEFKLWEDDAGGQTDSPLMDDDDYLGSIKFTKDTPDNNHIVKNFKEGNGRWRIACTKTTRKEIDMAVSGNSKMIPVRVPVLDQGSEGACVAFSVVGALTTSYLNKTKPGKSQESLFDPMALYKKRANPEISGWNIEPALNEIMKNGIPFKNNPSKRLKIKSYYKYHKNGTVTKFTMDDREKISEGGNGYNKMRAVLKSGEPLICRYDYYPDFTAYAGEQGVYGGNIVSNKSDSGHAVFVVGYTNPGIESNKFPTWLLQNSWGAEFGNKGLCKFAEGACGFDNQMYRIGDFIVE